MGGEGFGRGALAGLEGARGRGSGVLGAELKLTVGAGEGVGAPILSVLVLVDMASSSRTSGLLKSQGTPCLAQLPHRG